MADDAPKALSAEEEAVQRFLAAAKKTTRWNLMADDHSLVAFYSHTQHDKTGASPNDIAKALDAARAEADRLRQELEPRLEAERVAAEEIAKWEADGHYPMPAHGWTCFWCGETFKTPGAARKHFDPAIDGDTTSPTACLRALAADLVEGLRTVKREMWAEARRFWTVEDFRNWATIQMIDALIAKARAQGITAPKGERLEITVETPAETARSYDGIRRALGLEAAGIEPAPKGEKGEG